MNADQAKIVVNEIFSLYEVHGAAGYIGEPVSQIEHMCQAAQLAEIEGYDDEVILAAFFHDIGHLCEHVFDTTQMDGYGVMDHESLGSQYLREKGFSEKIARLVESHVSAKRYLTFKYPDYYNKLSDASKITLDKQRGRMNDDEAKQFESDKLYLLFIKIREWDDKAKVERVPLPSLEIYKQMAFHHLMMQN
jgi:2-amino-1-hydroxyethylphosphonate dioxygenase (glycine-forming)